MSVRVERVRELLRREIGEIVRRELPVAEAGLVTINEVTITPDLQNATAYFSILGRPEQKARGAEMLQQRRKLIQTQVGHSVVLKYTPHLKFVADDSIARGDRVLKILEELGDLEKEGEKPPENH